MIGRTSIVIAHRLSTIKTVDKILVLEKGKGLVRIGTFDELKNGLLPTCTCGGNNEIEWVQ
ncbi:hypothetical protein [Spiroplasma endosymbiont of Virgichneumon dumeticola]|uniref:hypothetical protein n=1 Tax=Spiroplasma endosymbiont of Virgichneumon dumeticola TaxID=3139323 RepID=UPI0035C891D5